MKDYYHIKIQEAYDNLTIFLETLGYSQTGGDKPTEIDIFHMLGTGTFINVSKEKKRLLYANTHTFRQIIEIDGVSLIEWTATSPKKSIEVSKEFDEWIQNSKEAHVDYKSWCVRQITKMGWDRWLKDPITDKTLLPSEGFDWTEEIEENKELHTRATLDGCTVKKEPMYETPLSCLKTTDGEIQYLSYKDKTWFASRKRTWLKQRFTETELREKVPKFYRELAREV